MSSSILIPTKMTIGERPYSSIDYTFESIFNNSSEDNEPMSLKDMGSSTDILKDYIKDSRRSTSALTIRKKRKAYSNSSGLEDMDFTKKYVTSNQKNQAYNEKIQQQITRYTEIILDHINKYMASSPHENSVKNFIEKKQQHDPILSNCLNNLDTMKKEHDRIEEEKREAKEKLRNHWHKQMLQITRLGKRPRADSDSTETRTNSDSISSTTSKGSLSNPSSPRRIRIEAKSQDSFSVKKSPHSISHPYGSYNIRFQTWNLGGIDPSISVKLWEEFIDIWIKNKRTNDEEQIKRIIDNLVNKHDFFHSARTNHSKEYKIFINKKKDSMYRNFEKSKKVVFSLLKFLHNKIECKNRFDYIFYSLQEVNYVMQKLLTSGIKLEEFGNFAINKFFTLQYDQRNYVASEYIISLQSSQLYNCSINQVALDYNITFSNQSNEFTNAIIYPKDFSKVKELSANIGTKFKNNLYTEWNNYLGQKQIQYHNNLDVNNQFNMNLFKTKLRSNDNTREYFKQFQNARDAKLHSNVLHGVIFELNDINFLLVNCHHPRLDNKWFEQLMRFNSMFNILDIWSSNNPNIKNKIILTGDFNINYNTKEGRKVYDFLVSREFDQETKDILTSFEVKKELYEKKEAKNTFVNYNEEKYICKDYKTQQSKNNTQQNNILDYIFVSSNIKKEGFDTKKEEIVVSDKNEYSYPTFIRKKLKSFSGNPSEDRYGLISDHGVEKLFICLNKKNKFFNTFPPHFKRTVKIDTCIDFDSEISYFQQMSNFDKIHSLSSDSIVPSTDGSPSTAFFQSGTFGPSIIGEDGEIIKKHFIKCKSNNVYKRALCFHYLNPKGCTKGDKCNFAHGSEEQTLIHKIHEFIRLYPKKTVNDFIESF